MKKKKEKKKKGNSIAQKIVLKKRQLNSTKDTSEKRKGKKYFNSTKNKPASSWRWRSCNEEVKALKKLTTP